MDPETLSEQLAKLHEELQNARELDPRSSELLAEVLQDIRRLIGAAGRRRTAAHPLPSPIAWRASSVQFEADHPTLAASSRRLIDLLGKAGL